MEQKRTGCEISWTKLATRQLLTLAAFIGESSEQQARKVVRSLHHTIDQAAKNPARFPADKYRTANDGTYRAFEKHHYRVTYRILKEEIRIVSVRHTSRRPLFH